MGDEGRTTMEKIESEIRGELAALLARLPAGPAAGRLAVLMGLAVEVSGAEVEDAWIAKSNPIRK